MASDVQFGDLNDDLLRAVFARCFVADLPALACVCRRWCLACSDEAVVKEVFSRRWRIASVHGKAPPELLKTLSLKDFAFRHRVQATDYLQSLALRFRTTAFAIRVQNNLLSEHAMRAHDYIYIPVPDEAFLVDKHLRFEAVGGVGRVIPVVFEESAEEEEEPPQKCSQERLLEVTSKLLRNRLSVSEDVAKFYVHDHDGDLTASAAAYWEDLEWEMCPEGRALLRGMQRRKWRWPRRVFEFFTCGLCSCCYAAEW